VIPTFDLDHLPGEGWTIWRKTALTRAIRISGAFAVDTPEGVMVCEDGWLALDSRGNPYPIDAAEFAAIYEAAP
jgi:hypothetical protein